MTTQKENPETTRVDEKKQEEKIVSRRNFIKGTALACLLYTSDAADE